MALRAYDSYSDSKGGKKTITMTLRHFVHTMTKRNLRTRHLYHEYSPFVLRVQGFCTESTKHLYCRYRLRMTRVFFCSWEFNFSMGVYQRVGTPLSTRWDTFINALINPRSKRIITNGEEGASFPFRGCLKKKAPRSDRSAALISSPFKARGALRGWLPRRSPWALRLRPSSAVLSSG